MLSSLASPDVVLTRPIALSRALQKILWEFRSTAPDDPYNEKMPPTRGKERAEHKVYHFRRFLLRSSVNRVPRPSKYARARERGGVRRIEAGGWDQTPDRCSTEIGESGNLVVTDVKGRTKRKLTVDIEYTIVTREEHPREKKEPGYKTHDSWRDVMAYLGCSRRTAFRKIREGYRIPEPRDVRVLTSAATLAR